MARLVPLCSSSKGNSIFVGDVQGGVLVDVGCSFKALKTSLELCGIPFEAIKAVVVTHEHIDHVKGLFQLTKHTDLPVYASRGTAEQLIAEELVYDNGRLFDCSELVNAPTDIEIKYFHTPHDSAESVGYTLEWGEHKVACCTDLGRVTDEVRANLIGCDAVYIEANYELAMLRGNPRYPYPLKQRIASDRGHLANADCGQFCKELVSGGTKRLVLGHLSQENNTPLTAYGAVSDALAAGGIKCGIDYTLNVAPVNTDGRYIIL
ncbi:MAG: MBL fold metallo-hydrolase [Eubacterium sp.]|nr:MBL fold metallo-hydrolase [Eubacterium sp.]